MRGAGVEGDLAVETALAANRSDGHEFMSWQ